jgi:hypothetical protein
MKIEVHLSYLAHFSLDWEMFQTIAVQKIKTLILCSVTFSENRAAFGIMWKNTEQTDRPQMTVQNDACTLYTR